MEKKKSLKDFILGAKEQLAQKVKDVLTPLYHPSQKQTDLKIQKFASACEGFGKALYPAQQDIVNALAKGFVSGKKALALIAEMGCGKTLMGLFTGQAVSGCSGRPIRTLVLCPPTLISTWKEEIEAVYGKEAKIINANGKDALKKFIRARAHRKTRPEKPEFWVIGLNRAKLGFGWKPSFWKVKRAVETENGFEAAIQWLCPHCGSDVSGHVSPTKRTFCPECKSPLWGPDGKVRRFAPALYIKRYLKGFFGLLICDEVHTMKGGNTIQGALLGQLAGVCEKTLILTGTLSGGKASDVFYIIQRAMALNYDKDTRKQILPPFNAVTNFVGTYGTIEEIYKHKEEDTFYGRSTKTSKTIKEKPGISPLVLKQFFIENTAFLRLSDIADQLPPFREELEFTSLPDALHTEYKRFEQELVDAAKKAMKRGDFKVLGQMLCTLLAWPDTPQKEAVVRDKSGAVVAHAPGFEISKTPKDERLIEILDHCRANKRKALVFAEYTGKWATDAHLAAMLRNQGFRPLVLKPAIQAAQRLDWIRARFSQGEYDCLICQPKLVEVGLNLREFPEIIFYQTGFSTYVLRQASRRSYRPGQTQEVVVRYMINERTIQEKCMSLIAGKLEASLVLEGELSDKGLVALSDIGDNMAVELARALVGELKVESLETQFAAYKTAEVHVDSEIGAPGGSTTVETATTIKKGERSQTFVTRKVIKVGEVKYSPGSGRAFGVIFRRRAEFRNGEILVRDYIVGTYSKKGVVSFHKQPERRFILKPQDNLLPGFRAFDVLEVKETAPAVQ